MLAVVFPGQGSQKIGMGLPWRDHPSWGVVERATEVTGFRLDDLLTLDRGPETFPTTKEAQLAVLTHSLMVWDAVGEKLPSAAVMAGHSLGQITALIASGTLTFEDGLGLALARADATAAAAEADPGAMAALLGCDLGLAGAVLEPVERAWVANDNGAGQIVIGGSAGAVVEASERAKAMGVRKVMPVAVAGAFHTPMMAPAAEVLTPLLASTGYRPPRTPVISNHDAVVYADEDWAERLRLHLTSPVQWGPTMQTVAGLGVTHIVEVGPGATLTALARRAVPDMNLASISLPDQVHSALEVTVS